jgi:hypothetical protein
MTIIASDRNKHSVAASRVDWPCPHVWRASSRARGRFKTALARRPRPLFYLKMPFHCSWSTRFEESDTASEWPPAPYLEGFTSRSCRRRTPAPGKNGKHLGTSQHENHNLSSRGCCRPSNGLPARRSITSDHGVQGTNGRGGSHEGQSPNRKLLPVSIGKR